MSVARTTRGISKIPGVSAFRLAPQPPVPELRVVSLDPCVKCRKEFKPLSDTPWDEVIQDVVEHVRLCERVTKEPDQGERHSRKTDEEKKPDERAKKRRTALQQDPWAALVEPTQVRCGACGTSIQLDKRRAFYPGLWNNHRARCTGIDQIFNRAERVLWSITREVFLLQENSPGREFLNFYTVNVRERRKQARRRKEGERRYNRRVKIRNPEHDYNTEEGDMYDSDGEDLHCPTGIGHSQDRKISVSTMHCNIASEITAQKLALPTTSKSLNSILCPVTAEEIENHHRQLERSHSGQDQGPEQVAYGADAVGTGFRKGASRQKRYHPYAKGHRSTAARCRSQSDGIDVYSSCSLVGHKSRFYLYPDRERCSTRPQNRVDGEFCGYDGQSGCIDFSPPTMPNFRLGDLMGDYGTGSSRASSPSTIEGGKGIRRCEEQNSTFGLPMLEDTCLGSPHYSPRHLSASFPPGSPVINISSLRRKLNHDSSCRGDFLPSLPQNQCDDGQHPCDISKYVAPSCHSMSHRTLTNVSSPVPRLRPLTVDSFERFVSDDCYYSDCSREGYDTSKRIDLE